MAPDSELFELGEDARLDQVVEYVNNRGRQHAAIIQTSRWTLLRDNDRERLYFRIKDTSTFMKDGNSHGIAVGLPLDDLRFLEHDQLIRIVGDRMLFHLTQGLPIIPYAEPYPKDELKI